MRENKLQIRIEARAEQFHSALRKVDADSSAFAKAVERMVESSSKKASDSVGKAAADITGKLNKAGKDSASSLDQVGDGADNAARELTELANRFASSADQAAGAARGLVNALDDVGDTSNDVKQVRAQLEQMEAELKQSSEAARSIDFATAIESGQRLAETLDGVAQPIRDAAAETRNLERRIKATFSNPKDQEAFLKAAKEIKAELGTLVDEDDLARSAEILGTLKVPVEDFNRVARASKKAGRDVQDGAQDLGEALANLGSGNADIEVLNETIRTNFGISGEALRKFGAVVDSTGKVLGRNRQEQRLAQKALRDYIDTSEDYSKIAERAADNQSLLADEVDKFNRAVGSQVTELKEFIAGGLLTLAKVLNELPDGAKTALAGIALLAGPLAKLAQLSLQVAGALRFLGVQFPTFGKGAGDAAKGVGNLTGKLKDLGPRMTLLAEGAAGTALGLGLIATAAVGAAYASFELVKVAEQQDEAESALIQTQAKLRREHKELNVVRKKSIETIREEIGALKEYVDQRQLATFTLLDAREAYDDAIKRGNKAEIDAAKERLAEAQKIRNQVDKDNAEEKKQAEERAKAKEEEFARAQEAYNQFKVKYDAGNFDSQQKALDALKSLSESLTGAPLEQAQKDIKALNKEILDQNLDRIEKEFEAGKISAKRAKELLNTQLSVYKANLDQRRDAFADFAEKEDKVNDARLRSQQKYLQEALNAEKNAIKERASLVENTSELPALEKRLDAGENVINLYKAEAAEQVKKLKALADEEAALDRIAIQREKAAAIKESPKDVDLIDDAAAKKLEEVNARVAAQKAKLDKDLAASSVAADEKRAKVLEQQAKDRTAQELALKEIALERFRFEQQAAADIFEQRRAALEAEEAQGSSIGEQRLGLEREIAEFNENRLKKQELLEIDLIKAKQAAANQGATAEQKILNDQRAQLDILQLQKKTKEEIKDIEDDALTKAKANTAEIEKQLKEQKKLNAEKEKGKDDGGFKIDSSFGTVTQGIEGLTSGFGNGFGKSKFKNREEVEEGPSEQELQGQLTRAKIRETEAKERARGTTEKPEPIDDSQRPQLVKKGDPSQSAAEAYQQTPQASANQQYATDPQLTALQSQHVLATQQGNIKLDAILRALTTIAQQGSTRNSGENAGARFAEGGTRLPGNPR